MDNPQKVVRSLRLVIAVFAICYLFFELFVRHDFRHLLKTMSSFFSRNQTELLLVLLLMPLNWLMETVKWRYMFSFHFLLSVTNAFRGVLMGVSVGLFTPNGIGEFAGRLLVVPVKHQASSVGASIAGSMSQLAVTLTIGGACLVYHIGLFIDEKYKIYAIAAALIILIVGLMLYFKMSTVARWIFQRVKWFSHFGGFTHSFDGFKRMILFNALMFSIARYAIFCLQLFVLLKCVVPAEYYSDVDLLILIPVYFYIQTLIPSVALSEIGIRGAILLFLIPEADGALLLLSSTLLWLINIVIPAMLGLVVSFTVNFTGRNT